MHTLADMPGAMPLKAEVLLLDRQWCVHRREYLNRGGMRLP